MDIAAVLVPGEFGVGVAAFDDVLFPKQIGRVAKNRLVDLDHYVALDKLQQIGSIPPDVGAEIALVAVIDADAIDAIFVKLFIQFVDGVLRLAP